MMHGAGTPLANPSQECSNRSRRGGSEKLEKCASKAETGPENRHFRGVCWSRKTAPKGAKPLNLPSLSTRCPETVSGSDCVVEGKGFETSIRLSARQRVLL